MSQVQLFSHRTECPLLTTQSNKSNDNNNNSQRPKAKISKKWRKENSSPRYISLSPVPPLSPPVLSPTFLKSPISFRSPTSILKSTGNNYNTSLAEPLLPSTSALSIRRSSNNHKTNSNSKLSRLSNHTGNKIHAFEEKQTEECLKQSSTCSSLPVITPPNSFAHYSILINRNFFQNNLKNFSKS